MPDSQASSAAPQFPEIMTIEQAALYLQLHPQVVYRHVRAGTLPASRIGRTIRFKKSVLDAFLEKDAWSAVGKFLKFAEKQAPPAAATPQKTPETPSERPKRKFSVDID